MIVEGSESECVAESSTGDGGSVNSEGYAASKGSVMGDGTTASVGSR